MMKDAMLIDSSLPNNFWAKAMKTANYFSNGLLTKSKSYNKLIVEEAGTNKRQNLSHI